MVLKYYLYTCMFCTICFITEVICLALILTLLTGENPDLKLWTYTDIIKVAWICYIKYLNNYFFSYQPIVDYIDAQFEAYLQEELKIKRSLCTYHDSRVHVCLYFISPTGHSLKTLDLLTMKSLDSKVGLEKESA